MEPAPPFARSWNRLAAVLGVSFAVFYAWTWNGRYLHDGPVFLWMVEQGTWGHVHAFYLPAAQVLSWLPGLSGPSALAVLAVASGTACVSLSTLLARRASDDPRVGLLTGLCIGFAPVVWAASGMVEIHILGGAAACLGAWVASAGSGPVWRRAGLATLVAMLGHLTNLLFIPVFVAMALEAVPRGRVRRDAIAALTVAGLIGAATYLLAFLATSHELSPEDEESKAAAVRYLWGLAKDPVQVVSILNAEFFGAWLVASAAPLAILLPGGRLRTSTRLVVAGNAILGALLFSCLHPLDGQYGLVLCPSLAIGIAHGFEVARRRRALVPAAVATLALLAVLAPGQHARLSADSDRDWALAVAPHVSSDSVVLCLGFGRKMRIQELTDATAVNFQPAGDHWSGSGPAAVVRALETANAAGQTVYLDPEVIPASRNLTVLQPVLDALREVATLTPAADGNLLRIE